MWRAYTLHAPALEKIVIRTCSFILKGPGFSVNSHLLHPESHDRKAWIIRCRNNESHLLYRRLAIFFLCWILFYRTKVSSSSFSMGFSWSSSTFHGDIWPSMVLFFIDSAAWGCLCKNFHYKAQISFNCSNTENPNERLYYFFSLAAASVRENAEGLESFERIQICAPSEFWINY